MTISSLEMETTACEPIITVAVVTYNHGPYIKRCLDSIMRQTQCRIDLVVVDDGSCDFQKEDVENYIRSGGSKFVESISVTAFGENQGPAKAYCKALELARGEYILFLGGDDYLAGFDVLTCISKHLMKETVDVLQAQSKLIDSEQETLLPDETDISWLKTGECSRLYQTVACRYFPRILCIQSAFFRTELLRELPVFTEEFPYAVDWDVYAQMISRRADFAYIPETITIMHSGGAYAPNNFIAAYIYKAYLKDASRAIRMYVMKETAGTDIHMMAHIAEILDQRAEIGSEWGFLSLTDKILWRRANREFVKTASSIKKTVKASVLSIENVIACLFAVFLLICYSGIVPASIFKGAFTIFSILYIWTVLRLCMKQRKSSDWVNYTGICFYQVLFCLFITMIKTEFAVAINAVWILLPVGVTLIIAVGIILKIVFKFIKLLKKHC